MNGMERSLRRLAAAAVICAVFAVLEYRATQPVRQEQ